MTEHARPRRVVALIAAYVVALQALLLPLSVAAGGGTTGLCLSVASSGSQPAGHGDGCPCAAGCGMQCCAPAALLPPQIVIARIAVEVVAVVSAPFSAPVLMPSDFDPHRPRGPPA
jgi:hypothetical protein